MVRSSSLLAVLALGSPALVSTNALLDTLGERAVQSQGQIEGHMGNLCDDEHDGSKCHDGGVLVCQGKQTTSYTKCKATEECEHGACQEEACKSKADGFHCSSDQVVECRAARTAGVTVCSFYEECKKDPLQSNMASCQEDVCQHKPDGSYCKDDHVVECSGGRTKDTSKCAISQKCAESGIAGAACEEKDCVGKASGTYCMHGGLVECQGMRTAQFTKCPFYQECSGSHGAAQCEEDACDDKSDGWHCKGDHRVKCEGSRTVDFEVCPEFQECHKVDGAAEPVCQSSARLVAPSAVVLALAALLRQVS
mmetsp:Transcript_101417/g.293337  ORF Transcript_101417/g.293337 Transcript_101417/m.293337 type:complete len:309 (-) Transcript_101417:236-1162(-)